MRITLELKEDIRQLRSDVLRTQDSSKSESLSSNTAPTTKDKSIIVLTPQQRIYVLNSAIKKLIVDNSSLAIEKAVIDSSNKLDVENKEMDAIASKSTDIGVNVDEPMPKVNNDDTKLKQCCGTLNMYLKNLVDFPNIPRYRKISTTNQSFVSMVLPVKGHDDVLRSVGFAQKGSYYEWLWAEAANSSSSPTDTTSIHKEYSIKSDVPSYDECKSLLSACIHMLEDIKMNGRQALTSLLKQEVVEVLTAEEQAPPSGI
jgi:hypothetical protein